jgi:hypothetical protein
LIMQYFHPAAAMLAQMSTEQVTRLLIWSGVLFGVLIVAAVVVNKVKRRLQQPDEPISAGFTLSDLRALHKSGQMSDEEFERAKEKVVEAARRAAERQAVGQAGAGRSTPRDKLT